MPKIIIKNFGPIEYFETDIKKVTLLIGPQSSGKSTISKVIFFFKSIRGEFLKYIYSITAKEDITHLVQALNKNLRQKFISFFGTTKHMDNFELTYFINESKSKFIKLFLKNGYVQVNYSQKLKNELESKKKLVHEYFENSNKQSSPFINESDVRILESEKNKIYKLIENQINSIFDDNLSTNYIPAGRSLITTLSEQLSEIDPYKLDFLMYSFVEKIKRLKPNFKNGLNGLIEDMKKFTTKEIDFDTMNFLIPLMKKILRGEYKLIEDEERIYFGINEYTKISLSSSGQQESNWILLSIFHSILIQEKTFTIIEEPEAHLYPEAQKNILELIILLANLNSNQIIITTHSPYILSAMNNLIYAKNLSTKFNNQKDKELENIINKKFWLNYMDVSAYFIDKSNTKNIIDEELNMVRVEEIDSASEMINNDYDKLFDLEFSNV